MGQGAWEPSCLPFCLLGDKKPWWVPYGQCLPFGSDCGEKIDWPMPEAKPLTQPLETLPHFQEQAPSRLGTMPWGSVGTARIDATVTGWAAVQPGQTQPRAKMGAAFLAPPDVTASLHGCPRHPRRGQGYASFHWLHPGPTLVRDGVAISQPHFWTFSAGQEGYFYWGLVISPFVLVLALEEGAGRLAPAGQGEESVVRHPTRCSNPVLG